MKRLILLIVTIGVLQSTMAQFKLGVKMGVTATNVSMNAATGLDDLELPTARRLNFDGGLVFEYDLMPDLLSIRSGLEYAQKGFIVDLNRFKEMHNDIKNISGDWKASFNYLQLPVSMVYKIGDFNINAGPYLAYGLGGLEYQDLKVEMNDGTIENIRGNYDLQPVFGSVEDDLSNVENTMLIQYFNGLDFGINVGFGFSIKNVMINAQYQQGFTNITPELANEPDFNPSDLLSKHNVLSIEVTYFFINKH